MKSVRILLGIGLLAGAFATFAANAPSSAPAPGSPPNLQPFTDLPAPMTRPNGMGNGPRIHAGTDGLALRAPTAATGRTSVAILGDLAPGDVGTREKYLRMAVSEINLLRPDAVLTVGNLVPGLTRSGKRYVDDTQHVRVLLDELKMPWYPCAGETDVVSGTRMPAAGGGGAAGDRRFEDLYRRYVGPLYFSVDIGGPDAAGTGGGRGIHAIVLDSEEGVGAGNVLSEAQLQWLKEDLNRTFESGRPEDVLVLLHRPLWQDNNAGGNWKRVHDLLVDFNRRPVVSVEGGPGGIDFRAPRALAVFAGGRRAYDQEPAVDGIRYYILGPTAAAVRSGESAAEAPRHFTFLKVDSAGEMHVALVQLGDAAAADAQTIVADDVIGASERAVVDAIAAWDEARLGVRGVVDVRGDPLPAPAPALRFHAENPLTEAVDIQVRLAPGGWELTNPPFQRHLTAAGTPGAQASCDLALRRVRAGEDRPVVEVVVRWPDARGRVHELVLPRPIAVVPVVTLTVAEKAILPNEADGWAAAPTGMATAWTRREDAPRESNPTIALRADSQHLFVRVHVADDVPSYWPVMKLDPAWGGLASDAVSVAWEDADKQVRRVWVLPFAPREGGAAAGLARLWSNTGLGDQQTALAPADAKWGIRATVTPEAGGYTVTFVLPRQVVCTEVPAPPPPDSLLPGGLLPLEDVAETRLGATARLNVAVHDNDETARTWIKSWARQDAGPDAWAQLQLMQSTAPEENQDP
jgi:hypothetical protein